MIRYVLIFFIFMGSPILIDLFFQINKFIGYLLGVISLAILGFLMLNKGSIKIKILNSFVFALLGMFSVYIVMNFGINFGLLASIPMVIFIILN